jgi:predicted PurR-regulated permease PerM
MSEPDTVEGPPDGSSPLLPAADPLRPIPWRTILASVFVVGATFLLYELVRELGRIITWVVVSGFFAVVLTPAVDWVQVRLKLRRGVATAIVFVSVLAIIGGMLYAFIRPIVDQVNDFVDSLPELVDDAQHGEGWVGEIVDKYNLDNWIDENRDRLQESLSSAGKPALHVVQSIFSTIVALLTIFVMTILMLMRGPQITDGALKLIAPRQRERVRIVAADAAKAVSGYMLGNFLISIIAGASTYVVLKILGVDYAEVLALWVAFADLIPMVGATLGAIPTIGLSFLHSPVAGFVSLGFYIVYQQFENHVLQVTIMARTVAVNPLTVLLSVLVGVELFGFLGALLAIPVAGVLQVVARNVYDERLMRWKDEPTVGAADTPIAGAPGFASDQTRRGATQPIT